MTCVEQRTKHRAPIIDPTGAANCANFIIFISFVTPRHAVLAAVEQLIRALQSNKK
jgi:hypothetical protein